jgi:hypothetical protein
VSAKRRMTNLAVERAKERWQYKSCGPWNYQTYFALDKTSRFREGILNALFFIRGHGGWR